MKHAKCLLCFVLCIAAVGLDATTTIGHEHPRRHRHGVQRSSLLQLDSFTDWDRLVPTSNFGQSEDLPDPSALEEPGPEDHWDRDSIPSYRKESQSFDVLGNSHLSKKVIKESKKDFQKIPKGSVLSSSSSFVNETNDRGSLTFSGKTTYDSKTNGKAYEDTDINKKRHLYPESEEPVPAATRSRDKESTPNDYLSAPRWTLKYQGMATEQALNNTESNVTAPVGGSAFLPCKVGHLGDRQISWIRRRDWHVLTSGKILYTHDQRFSVLHEPGSQDWTLHIKWVDMKDTGTYECQVSTGTGIISLFVTLRVVIPEAFIPGDGQYHVNKGSSISLNCLIKNSPSPPQYILWHHNGQLLNFLRNRPDFAITDNLHRNQNHFSFTAGNLDNGVDSGLITDSKDLKRVEKKMFASRLVVEVADEQHSGNYTCSAPNTVPTSTLVFITEGDKTAAVQRIDTSSSRRPRAYNELLIPFVVLLLNFVVALLS